MTSGWLVKNSVILFNLVMKPCGINRKRQQRPELRPRKQTKAGITRIRDMQDDAARFKLNTQDRQTTKICSNQRFYF